MDTGAPPGRFYVALGISFALGLLVEVSEEGLVDTGVSGTGMCCNCLSISLI